VRYPFQQYPNDLTQAILGLLKPEDFVRINNYWYKIFIVGTYDLYYNGTIVVESLKYKYDDQLITVPVEHINNVYTEDDREDTFRSLISLYKLSR
jgi:hypothetical protein